MATEADLARAYRARLRTLATAIAGRIGRLFASMVDLADIDAAFAAYIPAAAEAIEAGQQAGMNAVLAYLELLLQAGDLEVPRGIAGTTRDGATLEKGMDAFPAMLKAHVADGHPPASSLTFGLFIARRFADAEVTGAVDRTEVELGTQLADVRGWEGVLSGDSCPACRRINPGIHPMSEPMYRHGGCDCTKRIVTIAAE